MWWSLLVDRKYDFSVPPKVIHELSRDVPCLQTMFPATGGAGKGKTCSVAELRAALPQLNQALSKVSGINHQWLLDLVDTCRVAISKGAPIEIEATGVYELRSFGYPTEHPTERLVDWLLSTLKGGTAFNGAEKLVIDGNPAQVRAFIEANRCVDVYLPGKRIARRSVPPYQIVRKE